MSVQVSEDTDTWVKRGLDDAKKFLLRIIVYAI